MLYAHLSDYMEESKQFFFLLTMQKKIPYLSGIMKEKELWRKAGWIPVCFLFLTYAS